VRCARVVRYCLRLSSYPFTLNGTPARPGLAVYCSESGPVGYCLFFPDQSFLGYGILSSKHDLTGGYREREEGVDLCSFLFDHTPGVLMGDGSTAVFGVGITPYHSHNTTPMFLPAPFVNEEKGSHLCATKR